MKVYLLYVIRHLIIKVSGDPEGRGGTGGGLHRWVKESLPLPHTEGKKVLKICGRDYKVSSVRN